MTVQETAAPQTPAPTRPAKRAPLWTAGTTAIIALPTLTFDIVVWTGQAPAMPPSAHHILVVTAAACASLTVLLWALGKLFDWLDDRQEARVAEMTALSAVIKETYAQHAIDKILEQRGAGRLRPVN